MMTFSRFSKFYQFCLFLSVLGTYNATAVNYHVSISGTSNGDGSLNNPWSYEYAFDRYNPVKPREGDTLFIHEGNYNGNVHIWFGGNESANVVITNWQNDEVIIDGNTNDISKDDEAAIIYIQAEGGGFVTLNGLEIMDSQPTRTTDSTGSFPPYPQNKHGIMSATDNFEIKNCMIHDTHGNAIGCFGGNATITGNILYYNGWDAPDRGHAYGLYVQNADTSMHTFIEDNIIFANFSSGFHVYVTEGTIISNIHINRNIVFESGAPSTSGPVLSNIFVGGLRPLNGIEINKNHAYLSTDDRGNSFRVGYYQQANKNIEILNNYIIGAKESVSLRYCENLNFSGNTVVNHQEQVIELYTSGEDLSTWDVDDNLYYYTASRTDYMNGYNWESWKETYQFDINTSIFQNHNPEKDTAFIIFNEGMKHINVVAYDWTEEFDSVQVNLSNYLKKGVHYNVYDVQNLKGNPVVESTIFDGEVIKLPSNLTEVSPVIGNDVPNPYVHTPKEFNAFIITADKLGLTNLRLKNEGVNHINIYPNPATESFSIEGVNGTALVYLYAFNGSLVKTIHHEYSGQKINIENLPKGIYLVKIKSDKQFIQKQIIKY